MAAHYLEFERPIADLEAKIEELSKLSETAQPGAFDDEIDALRARARKMRRERNLTYLMVTHNLPVVSFVDTAGAYPGMASEERSVAEAIARSTEKCLMLSTPNVAVITGEGMSGGAIGIAATGRVLILEHAIYSVISPEGANSILWRGARTAAVAAKALKLTAQDLLKLKVVDRIIPEPAGGAHSDPEAAMTTVGDAIEEELKGLDGLSAEELKARRAERFYAIGRSGLQ